MKTIKILIILASLHLPHLKAQPEKLSVSIGTALGGPTPDKVSENGSARMKAGFSGGFMYQLTQSGNWSVNQSVSFQFLNLEYGQTSKRDTTVNLDIPLQNGEILNTNVNTYYYENVAGRMKLNFIKTGIYAFYNFSKFHIGLGPSVYCFSGGYDKGHVLVEIGEGGVKGIDDYTENYSNTAVINPFALEVSLLVTYKYTSQLGISLKLNRALTPFYNSGSDITGDGAIFYVTTVGVSLYYACF